MRNKIAITGASSEIGKAICQRLANKEDHFILQCCRHKKELEDWAGKLAWDCEVVAVDFTDAAALSQFCRELDGLATLINAAAVTKTGLLPALPDTDIAATISVNISSLVAICRAVLPAMLSRRKGCIVNLSSVAAARGTRGQSVYAGSKGFMESFTRSLAAEYGARGIRVNCVAPGPIEAGSLRELLAYAGDEVRKSVVSGRPGTPADVANAVAFLCNDEASFINGRVLAVDGGFCTGV